jgi:outer membrane protein assembly factor BamB
VLGIALALSLPGAATAAPGDWTRWKFDAANTGVNPDETRLGPGNVRGLRRTWFRDQCCIGTPLVAGGTVYISATDPGLEGPGAVMALDAVTGETRWSIPTGSPESPAGLALAGGRLFASLGFEAAGNPMLALDAATGSARWRSYVTRTTAATGPVAVAGGLAYVAGGGDGILLAKDVDNGVNRWKAFPGRDGALGGLRGAPSVRNGRVFVTTDGGSVLAYRAAGCAPALTCEPLWVRQLGDYSPYETTPGLGETTVFVGGLGRLYALDAATGRPRWSGLVEFTGDESAVTAPVIARGVVYATTVDNRVYAFPSAGCHASTCRPRGSG